MPQFRLTSKMAKALKVDRLSSPIQSCQDFYDDWYMDTFTLFRKKIIGCIHIRTRLAIAIFPSEIGGMKTLFEFFPFILNHHLYECQLQNYETIAGEIDAFFKNQKPIFTKTDHRGAQAHMTHFKDLFIASTDKRETINQNFCDAVSHQWLQWLIKSPDNAKDYTRPATLWQKHYNQLKAV